MSVMELNLNPMRFVCERKFSLFGGVCGCVCLARLSIMSAWYVIGSGEVSTPCKSLYKYVHTLVTSVSFWTVVVLRDGVGLGVV